MAPIIKRHAAQAVRVLIEALHAPNVPSK